MTYLGDLALALGMLGAGMAGPGPNVLAILHSSLADGRRAGLAVASGVVTGTVLWAVLTTAGLSALLRARPSALTAIKIVGGTYLAWLAVRALWMARRDRPPLPESGSDGSMKTMQQRWMRGLAVQMTNPKAILVWIAIVATGVPEDAPLWVPILLVVGAIVLSVLIHGTYALTFSLPPVVHLYERSRRVIDAVLGIAFGYLAWVLLTSAD